MTLVQQKYKIGDSRVLESRESADGSTIRRRRITSDGSHRFTTYERVEYPQIIVIKRDGRQEFFNREKLKHAISNSTGKFVDSDIALERIVGNVEKKLYAGKDGQVESHLLGEYVLDELASFNEVAYVRFASVFQKFATLDDFVKILELRKNKNEVLS